MTPDQIAKLSPETAATFTIPADRNYAQRKALDVFLRKVVPKNYKGMQGKTLFFEFQTSRDRDLFLTQLEEMIVKRGSQVERVN